MALGRGEANMKTVFFYCLILLLVATARLLGSVEGFVETFSGIGPYASSDGALQGFDNPDWNIGGDGAFVEDGFGIANNLNDGDVSSSDQFYRLLSGRGSFTSRLEVRDVELSRGIDVFASSLLHWIHYLNPSERDEKNVVSIALYNSNLNTPIGHWDFAANASGVGDGVSVPIADSIALEIVFQDVEPPQLTFRYFADADDVDPAVEIGPDEYLGASMLQTWSYYPRKCERKQTTLPSTSIQTHS
jgi:hypothetical protein